MICNKIPETVSLTAEFLQQGKICIIPTDTVYGFSGIVDYSSKFSTDLEIMKIKGRAENKPLIQLISDPEDIRKYSSCEIPTQLKEKWPGALTIIVPLKEPFCLKTPSVAFRCPGDSWLRDVIRKCGSPVYSTSVNRSGFPVLESFCSIQKEFGEEVDLLINDGDKKGSVPSTLILLENKEWKVLRQGSVIV